MCCRAVCAQFPVAINDLDAVICFHSCILFDPCSDECTVAVLQCLHISHIQIVNRCIISFTLHRKIIITDICDQLHPAHFKPLWIITMVNNAHHICICVHHLN